MDRRLVVLVLLSCLAGGAVATAVLARMSPVRAPPNCALQFERNIQGEEQVFTVRRASEPFALWDVFYWLSPVEGPLGQMASLQTATLDLGEPLRYEDHTPVGLVNEGDRMVVHTARQVSMSVIHADGRGLGGSRACTGAQGQMMPGPGCGYPLRLRALAGQPNASVVAYLAGPPTPLERWAYNASSGGVQQNGRLTDLRDVPDGLLHLDDWPPLGALNAGDRFVQRDPGRLNLTLMDVDTGHIWLAPETFGCI
jgi:hypothetical protein